MGELTRTDTAQADSRLARRWRRETAAQGDARTRRLPSYVEVVGRAPGALEAPELPPGLPASEDEAVEWRAPTIPSVDLVGFHGTCRAGCGRSYVPVSLLPVLTLDGEVREEQGHSGFRYGD